MLQVRMHAADPSAHCYAQMSLLAVQSIRGDHTGRSYNIKRALGHGAFGEVLLIEHAASQGQYAAKQLYMRDHEQQLPLRVLREMAALQQLHHPNVVALVDTAADGPCFYLVQELCRIDLAAVLNATSRHLPPPVAKTIMQQLLQAVAACHACSIMHRDIKPSNVLIDSNGVLKLGDFGLARSFNTVGPGTLRTQQTQQHQRAGPALEQCDQEQQGNGEQPQQQQEALAGDLRGNLHLRCQLQQCRLQQPAPHDPDGCFTAAQGTRWYRAPELLFGDQQYGPAVDMWAAGTVFAEILGLSPLIPGRSDIDQLARMQQTLGSITVQDWPEVEQLPDWHKIRFGHSPGQQLSTLLPDAPAAALDLLQGMICYNPHSRLTAVAALQHSYFSSDSPSAAGPGEVAAMVGELLQQPTPEMTQCQASFTWSDVDGSDSQSTEADLL